MYPCSNCKVNVVLLRMNRFYLILLMCTLGVLSARAQGAFAEPELTLGYFSNSFIHPGLKVGAQFKLKDWEQSERRSFQTFWSPQASFYSNLGNDRNLLFTAEGGIMTQKIGKKASHALSLGLGYLNESELLDVRVNLGSGDIENGDRDIRNYMLAMLNYSFDRQINERLSWYLKGSYAYRMANNGLSSALVFLDFGLKVRINGK